MGNFQSFINIRNRSVWCDKISGLWLISKVIWVFENHNERHIDSPVLTVYPKKRQTVLSLLSLYFLFCASLPNKSVCVFQQQMCGSELCIAAKEYIPTMPLFYKINPLRASDWQRLFSPGSLLSPINQPLTSKTVSHGPCSNVSAFMKSIVMSKIFSQHSF